MKKNTARRNKATAASPDAASAFVRVHSTLLRALTELYPCDPTAPGVVTAYLADKQCFYASIVRYEGAYGEGKKRLADATGATLEDALGTLASNWYNGVSSARKLRQLVRANERRRAAAFEAEPLDDPNV